jgi:hypothetical protein
MNFGKKPVRKSDDEDQTRSVPAPKDEKNDTVLPKGHVGPVGSADEKEEENKKVEATNKANSDTKPAVGTEAEADDETKPKEKKPSRPAQTWGPVEEV